MDEMSLRRRRTKSVEYYQTLSLELKNEQDLIAKWDKQSEEKLMGLVRNEKNADWETVATNFTNFGSTDCLKRYRQLKDIQTNKGPWNTTEDELLKYAIEKLGDVSWLHISSLVPGRNSKQCRERWCNQINPNINHAPFTQEEEELLIAKQTELGNKWSQISKFFNGRPDNMLKNMWHSLCTQRKLKKTGKATSKRRNTKSKPKQNTRKRTKKANNKPQAKTNIKTENAPKIRKTNTKNAISKNSTTLNNNHSFKTESKNITTNNTQLKQTKIKESKTFPNLSNFLQMNENNQPIFNQPILNQPIFNQPILNQTTNNSVSNLDTQFKIEQNTSLPLNETTASSPTEDNVNIATNKDNNTLLDTTETLNDSLFVMQYTLFNPENLDEIYIPIDNEFDQYCEENFDLESDLFDSLSNGDYFGDLDDGLQNGLKDTKKCDFYY
ncbi:transcription factor myb3r-2 [Anaeramoeba flamelloides]|uniref:Transcription factor myb3r-2 n=1 Tax=Anaeramoeba flamelloides TaxID=1746091 RepID=A0AAV7ZB53_9EUKA|nr:transcription factor myb3r-2 [Anaeramoeba flamelloides]